MTQKRSAGGGGKRVRRTDSQPTPKVKSVEPVTENHKDYIRSIVENDITICIGPSGSGKSYICAGLCAQWLHKGQYDQVVVTRPLVNAGKDIGALPGEIHDKSGPYMGPMQENFLFFLGKAFYGHYVNNGQLRYEILETMRGATFNRTLMILDEAQNCTADQIKMFMTRIGKDSKVIINGDTKQTDIRSKSGLYEAVERMSKVEGVGIVTLTRDDIQRNGIIGRVLDAWES